METIGGQAVIEGVMLRRKNKYTVAVRNPKNKIVLKKESIKDHRKGLLSIFKIPFFRGMYAMYEMLGIGMKTLTYSTNVVADEEEEKISGFQMFWIILLSFLFAICFFVVIPYFLTVLAGIQEHVKPVMFNIVDAVIKVIFFIAYIVIISQLKDIRRVFQYHGAEHMTVHCYEAKKKITVDNVKKFSPIHPRCGSSFIMLTIVISIIIFSLLPLIIQAIAPGFYATGFLMQKVVLALLRILVIPIIIGFSYELLKLAGKYTDNILMIIISTPGKWLQKLTTSKPDKKQIEVAIAAIKGLL